MTRNTNNKKDPQTKHCLGTISEIITGGLKHVCWYQPHPYSDVDQDRCLVHRKDPYLIDVPSPITYKSRYKSFFLILLGPYYAIYYLHTGFYMLLCLQIFCINFYNRIREANSLDQDQAR